MITKINSIRFVRSIKIRKSKTYPKGFKPSMEGGKKVWEDGVYFEKIDEARGINSIVLDENLKQVNDIWIFNQYNEKLIINTNK